MVLVFGVSHKTAPISVRQQLAFTAERIGPALRHLKARSPDNEIALISTCNRIEFYCDHAQPQPILEWWWQYLAIDHSQLLPYVYHYSGSDAVKHMMRVASGLDSMMLGEPQILGQLKLAYQTASDLGSLGKRLKRLFQLSFSVAKKIRTHTDIGTNPVSVAYAAVKLAEQIFTHLSDSHVLLIGAGQNIELLAQHLRRCQIKTLIIANRSMDRAYQLAQRYQAQAISLAEVPDYLATVDIVMSSTSSPDFMLSAPMVTEALKQGKRHPLLMIDLAVPADLDPALSMHEDIYLYTVDDLQGVIEQNLQLRQHAATQAEIIIDAQAKEYMSWLQTEQALSTLCAYRQKVTQVKNEALQKALAKLQKGDDPEQVLIHLAHQLSQKLMHGPSIRLRQAGVDQEEYILHSTRELFGLVE